MDTPAINQNGYEIPEKTLVVVPHKGTPREDVSKLLEPLSGKTKREWFNSHFYYCLPLTIANQYGFIIKAAYDFSVVWHDDPHPDALEIKFKEQKNNQALIKHFGSGILTIANPWHVRTPPGINIMTIAPPNMPKDGIFHINGVVETDNLQRDFSFNLKITRPYQKIEFKEGDAIGAFIPIPRYFADSFFMKFADEIYSQEQINLEHDSVAEFARQRQNEDKEKPHMAGRKYFLGLNSRGEQYTDHQLPRFRRKNNAN